MGVKDMNKFKSKALWLSIASLVLIVTKEWLGLSFDTELFNRTVEAVLVVLIGMGIISDNSKGEWYKDEWQAEQINCSCY